MTTDRARVVVAAYNGELYVRHQLQSILACNWQGGFDVYVYLDPSVDQTKEMVSSISSMDDRVLCKEYTDSSGGACNNFSRALADAYDDSIEYYLLCDQDDAWMKDKIDNSIRELKQLEVANGSDGFFLVFTDSVVVDENLDVISKSFWKAQDINPSDGQCFEKVIFRNVAQGCTMVFNKALLKKALPIPEDAMMHDWWLLLVATCFGKVSFLDYPTLLYRQHSKNVIGGVKRRSGWLDKIRRFVNERHIYHSHMLGVSNQAAVFLERYKPFLTEEKARLLSGFVGSRGAGFSKKLMFMKRNGKYVSGWYNKIVFVICFLFFYK